MNMYIPKRYSHFLVEHELPVQVLPVHRFDAGVGQLLRHDQPLRVGHDGLRVVDRWHHSTREVRSQFRVALALIGSTAVRHRRRRTR